jgi:hypothetical protein
MHGIRKLSKIKAQFRNLKLKRWLERTHFFQNIYISYTQAFLIKRGHNLLSMSVCRVTYHWSKQHISCFAENHKYFITLYRLATSPFWNVRATSNLGVLLNWETKTKRNETKRNEAKYNETKRKMKKRNKTKWSITKRNEICQTKHKRSKNNQWRGKNQRNIEWLVRLFIDLHLDAFLLQNSKRSTKVMHQYSKYILNSLKC